MWQSDPSCLPPPPYSLTYLELIQVRLFLTPRILKLHQIRSAFVKVHQQHLKEETRETHERRVGERFSSCLACKASRGTEGKQGVDRKHHSKHHNFSLLCVSLGTKAMPTNRSMLEKSRKTATSEKLTAGIF